MRRRILFDFGVLSAAALVGAAAPGAALADPRGDARAADARKDYAAELAILLPQARAGHAWAQNNLGLLYRTGRGVPADPRVAVDWFQRATAQGDAGGEVNLGEAYREGSGVTADPGKAASLFRQAGDQGRPEARAMLQLTCLLDRAAAPADCRRVPVWVEEAANAGDVRAEVQLAQFYDTGLLFGFRHDPGKAVFWYGKAADQGDPAAMDVMALHYDTGIGVTKDAARALALYEKAAADGDMLAQMTLARRYEDPATRDDALAFRWNDALARQGVVDAQRKLGTAYALGRGVEKDDVQAYAWFTVAVDAASKTDGADDTVLARDAVAQQLTPAQLDIGRKRASTLAAEIAGAATGRVSAAPGHTAP